MADRTGTHAHAALFRPMAQCMVQVLVLVPALVLVAALSGCATTTAPDARQAPYAPLTWDYERDLLEASQERNTGRFFDNFGRLTSRGLLGGSPQPLEEITLTPRELNDAILEALAPRPRMLPLMGRGARSSSGNSMSLAPEARGSDTMATPADAGNDAPDTWSIASSNDGQIVTDWQAVPGREAGLLWWKKRYQTEVRHTITIKQAMRDERLSSYSIQTEVRERPNPSYAWAPADPELGRAAFLKVKAHLWRHIQRQSMEKKAAP